MYNQFKKLNFWLVLGLDVLLLSCAHILAYCIRFAQLSTPEWHRIALVLPFLLPFKIIVFSMLGLYRGMWRYTGINDLLKVIKAVVITTITALAVLALVNRLEGFSRSVFILDGILTLFFIGGFRLALRLYYQHSGGSFFALDRAARLSQKKRLLIIGAGDAAEKMVREIRDNPHLPYLVVGFLDDMPVKIGNRIHGITVLAPISELHETIIKTKSQEVLIAIPSASREQMQRIVDLCRTGSVPYKTLPSLGEIINNKISIRGSRDVAYRDLLGRPQVRLEQKQIEEVFQAKSILVTGAGGSIGSELCRQLLRFAPAA